MENPRFIIQYRSPEGQTIYNRFRSENTMIEYYPFKGFNVIAVFRIKTNVKPSLLWHWTTSTYWGSQKLKP
jgi:hypothetical protein